MPESLDTIPSGMFDRCDNLQIVNVPENLKYVDEMAFQNDSHLKSFTFPEGLKGIGRSGFSGCSSLGEILLPNSVDTIGESCFSWCSSAKRLVLSTGIKEIPNSAFSYCDSLSEIIIPEGVTTVGDRAFCYTPLVKLTLPSTLTSIGRWAFAGTKLVTLYNFATTPATCGKRAFFFDRGDDEISDDNNGCTLFVPLGCKETYQGADGWSDFIITEFDATGLTQVSRENMAKEVSRYNLNGVRVNNAGRGISIVKLSDGSVRKILVK